MFRSRKNNPFKIRKNHRNIRRDHQKPIFLKPNLSSISIQNLWAIKLITKNKAWKHFPKNKKSDAFVKFVHECRIKKDKIKLEMKIMIVKNKLPIVLRRNIIWSTLKFNSIHLIPSFLNKVLNHNGKYQDKTEYTKSCYDNKKYFFDPLFIHFLNHPIANISDDTSWKRCPQKEK